MIISGDRHGKNCLYSSILSMTSLMSPSFSSVGAGPGTGQAFTKAFKRQWPSPLALCMQRPLASSCWISCRSGGGIEACSPAHADAGCPLAEVKADWDQFYKLDGLLACTFCSCWKSSGTCQYFTDCVSLLMRIPKKHAQKSQMCSKLLPIGKAPRIKRLRLLHFTTQTASVQVILFSAAIYQWRASSNTSRHRFALLSALFFERTRRLGPFPELQCCVAMRYAVKPFNRVAMNCRIDRKAE